MYETLSFTIRGIAPLLMHNGQLANPFNEFTKRLKALTGKRKKTEADMIEIAHVEFLGSAYVNDKGAPCVPGENIEAMLIDAAKKDRMGDQAKAGIVSDGNWAVVYDGPKDTEKLWGDKRFVDQRMAGVNAGRILRTRPMFRKWELTFEVSFLPVEVNRDQLVAWVKAAGGRGLCDYTPKFGRFEVVEAS